MGIETLKKFFISYDKEKNKILNNKKLTQYEKNKKILDISLEFDKISLEEYHLSTLENDFTYKKITEYEKDKSVLDTYLEHGKLSRHEYNKNLVEIEFKHKKIDEYEKDNRLLKISHEIFEITTEKYNELKLELDFTYKKIDENSFRKELANLKNEPYFNCWFLMVNENNPAECIMQFDWNDHMITYLKSNNYKGKSEEEVIKNWFDELCRNAAYEQGYSPDEVTEFITKKKRDDGKTDIY